MRRGKISCRAFRREKNILSTRLLERKILDDPLPPPPPLSRVKWSALKHQTFLIHERKGWPRGIGSGRGLHAKCESLSKTTWNHHERRQNNSVENAFQRFALSFVSFLRRKHDFRRRISTFVWRILIEEPRIWIPAFNLRTRVLNSVTAAHERLDMRSGCHAAKILPVGVRGTKKLWCLSSLLFPAANL